jgi:hypothetical protein
MIYQKIDTQGKGKGNNIIKPSEIMNFRKSRKSQLVVTKYKYLDTWEAP